MQPEQTLRDNVLAGAETSRRLIVCGPAILTNYRAQESEPARTKDLLTILPKGRRTVLEIGARQGFFSRLLAEHFHEVTALDLKKPQSRAT